MFTGLVETVGTVDRVSQRGGDARIVVRSGSIPVAQLQIGDSVAVSGVCLTVVERTSDGFAVDASAETLSCTTVGTWAAGRRVNLERAVLPTTRLGGHLVSGHVDGIATVERIVHVGGSRVMTFVLPAALARYVALKGSICIDGVSLTVNHVQQHRFDVNIIPHTASATTVGDYAEGQRVNIEVDLVARYVERLLQGGGESARSGITADFLAAHGYVSGQGGDQHGG